MITNVVIIDDRDVRSSTTSPTGDARLTAVLAVLAGAEPGSVSERLGVARGVLDRWVQTFVDAGHQGLSSGSGQPVQDEANRDRYLGLVAHELRSPLTMIQGWIDVLREDDAPEVQEQGLRSVESQVKRLRRLADDALDATSVALGRLQLQLQAASLAGTVRRILGYRSLDAPEVEVVADSTVNIDVQRLGQILDNLLDNARKHSVGSPRITVRRQGLFGEVVVSSPGPAISEGLARIMFEPFERGSTAAEGVGLGLYVCRSLTVAHGGQIGLRVDDDGNHFWLRLPVVITPSSGEGNNDMAFEFACGDVMPGCAATFKEETSDDLLVVVADHAKTDHDINEVTPELKDAVTKHVKQT